MWKRIFSGIMLTVLLMSMLTLTFNMEPVKAQPIAWTVDDDGPADFSTIQEAIDVASPGDLVYVYNGTYNENLYITTDELSLTGESAQGTIIDGGNHETVQVIGVDDFRINGFRIQGGSPMGIYLWDSIFVIIDGNDISGNFEGILTSSISTQ